MDIGTVQNIDLDEQMRSAYLDYAMSVIVSRALPDARDGLKPVHRRILYAMHDMGIRPNTAYKKSARIVGEVLGKYHPHGDSAVYEAMARMAQDFSLRYLLVDGQGNFGSIDGDAPAAMRYTEARLHPIAAEMLADLEQNTVDFVDNFDGSLQEPSVLPALLPNMLLNGSSGIAVGMATNIPPHNLREVASGIIFMIDNYGRDDGTVDIDELPFDDLAKHIPGPDFPTGGIIIGTEGIQQAYSTGRGRLVLRGLAHIEEMGTNRHRIVVTEIPYQLNKTSLLERIAELAREGRLDEISDLRDESDRRGMSIVIELRRGAQPNKVLNQLYKFTPLQSTFGVQMLALVDGEPRLLPLKRAMQIYIDHRREVIVRRSQFQLDKARARAHILEGLLIALANLDEVIRTIRESPDADVARERLMKRFKLSELQAQAILDMQLRRLAALERQKIQDEQTQVLQRIAELEDLLATPRKVLALIKGDLEAMVEKYGDDRRTRIAPDAHETFREEDLVAQEDILISITQRGYIKRVPARSFRAQARGGRGVTGHTTRDEDELMIVLPARTLDTLLFFSDRGKVYSEKAYQIPDADRTGKGIPMVNVLSLEPGETITAAVACAGLRGGHVLHHGYSVRAHQARSALRVRLRSPSGMISITLSKGDELGWVRLTNGQNDIILVTEKGQACVFRAVYPFDGQAGSRCNRHQAGARRPTDQHGSGGAWAQTCWSSLPGVTVNAPPWMNTPQRPGHGRCEDDRPKCPPCYRPIVSARVVQPADDLTIISSGGLILRTKVSAY
jgi:DNA gyrase subunit A